MIPTSCFKLSLTALPTATQYAFFKENLYNGNLFLRELEKELECSYVQRKELEEEFDRGLELRYTPPYERLDFFDKE